MSDLWASWADLTRFLESARLAFERESNLWSQLQLAAKDRATISVSTGRRGKYRVSLDHHVLAVSNRETLYASVLIHSYALTEAAVVDASGLTRLAGGVEQWGATFLAKNGKSFTDVRGGLGGAVATSITRNAFAHGERTLSSNAVNRLASAGDPSHAIGERIVLDYAGLTEHRGRLRDFLNVGGLGDQA